MSVPDYDQVREALEWFDSYEPSEPDAIVVIEAGPSLALIVDAAREWLGLESALVIRRDADGEWPYEVLMRAGQAYAMTQGFIDPKKRVARRYFDDAKQILDALSGADQ